MAQKALTEKNPELDQKSIEDVIDALIVIGHRHKENSRGYRDRLEEWNVQFSFSTSRVKGRIAHEQRNRIRGFQASQASAEEADPDDEVEDDEVEDDDMQDAEDKRFQMNNSRGRDFDEDEYNKQQWKAQYGEDGEDGDDSDSDMDVSAHAAQIDRLNRHVVGDIHSCQTTSGRERSLKSILAQCSDSTFVSFSTPLNPVDRYALKRLRDAGTEELFGVKTGKTAM